jgi:hypothetical protein
VPLLNGRSRASSGCPRLIALIAGAVALAGCSWFGADEDTTPPPPCPPALILDGAERTIAFAPGRERQGSGVLHLAAVRDLQSSCAYTPDGLDVDLRFAIVVEPGPAHRGEPADLDLFVATVGPDRRVLGKRRIEVRVELPEGAGRVGRIEDLTLRLPLFEPDQARTRRLFLGFQLAPGESGDRIDRFLR